MNALRSLLVAGVATLFLAAVPARAQDMSVNDDLKTIYKGIYSLYEKAENGDPKAAFYMASLHLTGVFLPLDREAGLKFLEVAAGADDPDGLYYLGLHYQHGMYDYPVDEAKAAEMIGKAAEMGHPAAKLAMQHIKARKDLMQQ